MPAMPASPLLTRLSVCFACLVGALSAQVPGVSREQMWPAPSAADWKKPVTIKWQRTWEDAVKLSKQTGRPILVCVNMDGELASEHYAGIRYRSPEIGKLYEPYVCVIASVYRHNPRDHDEQGRRIPCPRFGGVTCGEHIVIEPLLYEKYFEGERVAPRHIMIELDGKEQYDIYYAFDLKSVFNPIREAIEKRDKSLLRPDPRKGDRDITDLVASPDQAHRSAVEQAYLEGSREMRKRLMMSAMARPKAAAVDLLRLAVFGLDPEMAALARQALAKARDPQAIWLINDALRVPLPAQHREMLLAALDRFGADDSIGRLAFHARRLAAVHRGLGAPSKTVDLDAWAERLAGAVDKDAAKTWSDKTTRLEYRAGAARSRPEDPAAQLELAEANLAIAVDPEANANLSRNAAASGKFVKLLIMDARRGAERAEKLGAKGWKVDAIIGLCSYYLGDKERAHRRAERAVASLPPGEPSWNAMAVLGLFAESRMAAISKAVQEKQDWPKQWMTDVHSACSVLARHPLGTVRQVLAHYDFLWSLGAGGESMRVLERGLRRFADDSSLHDRLRGRVLVERGAKGLETMYDEQLQAADAPPSLRRFAAYACMVAAEYHRRRNRDGQALQAYDRAIAHYERCIREDAGYRATGDHFIAMSLAAKARLQVQQGAYAEGVDNLLASFQRSERSAATLDGLNISPAGTAKMALARLQTAGEQALRGKLEAAVKALDPALLQLPAFERGGPRTPAQARPDWRQRREERRRRRQQQAEQEKRQQEGKKK